MAEDLTLQTVLDQIVDKQLERIVAAQDEWLISTFGSLEAAEQFKGRLEIEESTTVSPLPTLDDPNNTTLRIETTFRLRLKDSD